MTPGLVVPAGPRSLEELVSQRFPLVPRPKPACAPVADRIRRVHHQTRRAASCDGTALLHAAEAHNLAALILSDCGMSGQARALCRRQFTVFAGYGPFDQATAKLALQPLINIGRLDTRAGNGHAAYQLHQAMLEVAKARTATTLDGQPVDLARIIRPGDDHREIVGWLWTVLLADGLRALCRAGRWSEAHAQAERHHGIGDRLLDGRQIAIIHHSTAGEHATALRLLGTTAIDTPWEQAVAACLKVLCLRHAGELASADVHAMLAAYLSLTPEPLHTAFAVRLAVTAAALSGSTTDTRPVLQKAAQLAADTADAYAAQEVLTLADQSMAGDPITSFLHDTVTQASLGTRISDQLLNDLMSAVATSEQHLTRGLAVGPD